MKEEETAPLSILKMALHINQSNLEKMNWQEEFIEYIRENNSSLYNEAEAHADYLKENGWFSDEEKQKWGMK
tara:strand:+ start:109 stop:324 length:216 start_codon:yes stop_codon:yes gene_type:complete